MAQCWEGKEVGAELWLQQGMLSLGQDLPEGRKRREIQE